MRRMTCVGLLWLALMAACGDVERIEIRLGETAVLDGEREGSGFTYRWSLVDAPAGSEPLLVGVGSSRLHVTPDVPGLFRVAVEVQGSRNESEETEILVHPAPPLDGVLKVRVVDADTGQPLSGVTVSTDVELSATTDASGEVVLSAPELTGARTVHVHSPLTAPWDRDGDPVTPEVDGPLFRGVTLAGLRTAEVTVPLRRVTPPPRVPVRAPVDPSLFDLLPEVDPVLAVGRNPMSGQLRAVLFAPVQTGELGRLALQDVFTSAPAGSMPLNLATDDELLEGFGSLLGWDRPIDFTHVETRVAPGRRTFFVLGGLVTFHLDGVRKGWTDEKIGRVARAETALGFVGVVTLDVPEGGLELTQPLTADAFDAFWRLPGKVERLTQSSRTPLHDEPVTLERVRLSEGREVRVKTPPPLADRRLERWALSSLRGPKRDAAGKPLDPVEWHWFDVPGDTGPAETDVSSHLLVTAATTRLGVIPLGFALVRDAGIALEETVFRLPEPTGLFEGARWEVMALATRSLWGLSGEPGGAVGSSRHVVEVVESVVPPLRPGVFPHDPSNRWNPFANFIEADRTDVTTPRFDRVRARPVLPYINHRGVPRDGLVLETPGASFVRARLTFLKWIEVRRFKETPLWEMHVPAGETTTIPWPPWHQLPLESGDRIELEVTALGEGAPSGGVWTLTDDRARRAASDSFHFELYF